MKKSQPLRILFYTGLIMLALAGCSKSSTGGGGSSDNNNDNNSNNDSNNDSDSSYGWTVTVVVRDNINHNPIAGARVEFLLSPCWDCWPNGYGYTDSSGKVTFNGGESSEWSIQIKCSGYETEQDADRWIGQGDHTFYYYLAPLE